MTQLLTIAHEGGKLPPHVKSLLADGAIDRDDADARMTCRPSQQRACQDSVLAKGREMVRAETCPGHVRHGPRATCIPPSPLLFFCKTPTQVKRVTPQPQTDTSRWKRVEHGEEKRTRFEDGTEEIIGALIEVHRHLGPGLLESAYEACLSRELVVRGLRHTRQCPLSIVYKGVVVDCSYRLDVVVEERVLLELKTIERVLPIHKAQVITYLRLSGLPVGLLVNFNVRTLKDGLHRLWP
jgi:GxxExxY protein